MPLEKGAWDEMGVPEINLPKSNVPRKQTVSLWERLIFGLVVFGWLLAAGAVALSAHGVDVANTAVAKAHELKRDFFTCQAKILQSYPPCRSKKNASSGQCFAYMSTVCSIENITALQRNKEAMAIRWRAIAKAADYAAWFLSVGTTLLFYGLRLLLTGRLRPLWPLGKHD